MINFKVLNRWTAKVQFTASIDCSEDASSHIRAGLALEWGFKNKVDLRDAVLTGADLTDAVLTGADLTDAVLRGAVLTGAVLRGADLTGVPVVENIDAAILSAIEAGGKLDMTKWHRCGTTHCRAGWAITLAGAGGAALEFAMGSAAAGALIYAASRPGKPVPDFYCDNDKALVDLKASTSAT